MKPYDELIGIYAHSRPLLPQIESLHGLIIRIKHPELRERMLELSKAIQIDLMTFLGLLLEMLDCYDNADVESLSEINSNLCDSEN